MKQVRRCTKHKCECSRDRSDSLDRLSSRDRPARCLLMYVVSAGRASVEVECECITYTRGQHYRRTR